MVNFKDSSVFEGFGVIATYFLFKNILNKVTYVEKYKSYKPQKSLHLSVKA